MKHIVIFVLFSSLSSLIFAQKQSNLVLQHKKNHSRYKVLVHNEFYKIKALDTAFISRIVNHTDSTLSVERTMMTDFDTIYGYGEHKIAGKKFYKDTLAIKFSDVQYIKIAWFKNRDFFILPAYLCMASSVAIVFVPIVSLIESGQVDVETLVAVASISAISWTILFIGTRNKKYDTQKKWMLMTKEQPSVDDQFD